MGRSIGRPAALAVSALLSVGLAAATAAQSLDPSPGPSASSGASANPEAHRIGLIATDLAVPATRLVEQGAREAAEALGWPYERVVLDGLDERQAERKVARLLRSSEVVILDALRSDPDLLATAAEVGIPVVVTVVGDPDSAYDALVAVDDEEGALQLATYLNEHIAELPSADRTVISIACPPETPGVESRTTTFDAAMIGADFAVISGQSTASDPNEAQRIVADLLDQAPDASAVYSCNAPIALGAAKAIEEAGREPGVDIVHVTFGTDEAALDAIAQGTLAATVAQDFEGIGTVATAVAKRLLGDTPLVFNDVRQRAVLVPFLLVTAEDVEAFRASQEP